MFIFRIGKKSFLLPLTQNHINYKKPALFDDVLTISAWIKKIKTFSIKFEYEIHREQELIANGYTEHACISSKTNELLEFPEDLRKALEGYIE